MKKVLSVLCMVMMVFACMTQNVLVTEAEEMEEVVVFEGEHVISASWSMGPSLQTANGSGTFDASSITAGGYFAVEYTGTEGAIYLAFSEWTGGVWASVNSPSSTTATADGYKSVFNYADCLTAYGTSDFSDVDAITVGTGNSTGETVIKSVKWYGYPTEVDLGEKATILYKGSPSAEAAGSCLKFFYTKHVGGEWDASMIKEGSYFYVEYMGTQGAVSVALSSSSGATRWAEVRPDESGVLADGRCYSKYEYDTFAQAFGTNFARLDQIQIRTLTNDKITLKRVAYIDGEGSPVDTSDGTWDRPDSGIAFIGDSIVENPLVDDSHLNNIDWNGILGRTDCVNYGIGGQTTVELAARIGELAKKNYDKVVMNCGINDIGRGWTNEQIVANYNTMFAALKATNPNIQIYLMSVLPTTPVFYTEAQGSIRDLNVDLQALAEATENVTFVNNYPDFYDETTGYCKEGLTFDGLHPNLTGYALIAANLNPYLEEDVVTPTPTPVPTAEPTVAPTAEPTVAPTAEPTVAPTAEPTVAPTAEPTVAPTAEPTVAPTAEPTVAPTTAPTVAPTVTAPTSAPATDSNKPIIKESGEKGWDAVKAKVQSASNASVIAVNMNGCTVVPSTMIEAIKGKDAVLAFDMGNGVTWQINGKDVTGDKIKDVDFATIVENETVKLNNIPQALLDKVAGNHASVELSISYDGEFGFLATLNINLGAENADKYANLYYYNEQTSALEFVSATKIDKSGVAAISFAHASEYTIIITDEPINAVTGNSPKTGEGWFSMMIIVISAFSLLAGVTGIYMSKRKLK